MSAMQVLNVRKTKPPYNYKSIFFCSLVEVTYEYCEVTSIVQLTHCYNM